jgi:chromodomain-helicase-DNA-binding protein 4
MKVSITSVCELGSNMTPKIIATWDSPPRQDEPGYSAFKVAFERFLDSRRVHIKLRNKKEIETFERRRKNEFRQNYVSEKDQQPDLGQQERLKLMPFQVNYAFRERLPFVLTR